MAIKLKKSRYVDISGCSYGQTTIIKSDLKKRPFSRYVDIFEYINKKWFLKVIPMNRPFSRNIDISDMWAKNIFIKEIKTEILFPRIVLFFGDIGIKMVF